MNINKQISFFFHRSALRGHNYAYLLHDSVNIFYTFERIYKEIRFSWIDLYPRNNIDVMLTGVSNETLNTRPFILY